MKNIFAEGIRVTNGVPYAPSITFIDDKTTGLFRTRDFPLGVAVDGSTNTVFTSNGVSLKKGFTLERGAVSNAYLRGNVNGEAFWQKSPIQSNSISWNSIYNSLDMNAANDTITVTISDTSVPPNVVVSKESNNVVANNDFYIKNKTTGSFQIYSTLPALTQISNTEVTDISVARLSNNCIGVCYYDINQDRVIYKYSLDALGKSWSDEIIPDDVSAVGLVNILVVDGNPALLYIYNEGVNDEWRYIRATNANGSSWGSPVVLYTSSTGVNFLPISLYLLQANGVPTCFYNDENGRAKLIISADATGSSWGSPINVSNLSNHQLISVKIVNGNPAVIAKSNAVNNIYYVRATNVSGSAWPVGASQLYKKVGDSTGTILLNPGHSSCDMSVVNGSLCIAVSELSTNDLYLNIANDVNGASWQNFDLIMALDTTALYPQFFTNNSTSYLLFNKSNGTPSAKCLLKFANDLSYTINEDYLPVFNIYSDHEVISNTDDGNSMIFIVSDNSISLLRFYEDDFKLNWISHLL